MKRSIALLLIALPASATPLGSGSSKKLEIAKPPTLEVPANAMSLKDDEEKPPKEHKPLHVPNGKAVGWHRNHPLEVPEPMTSVLFGLGLLGLAWGGRRWSR